MASSIDITQPSPSVAYFSVLVDAGAAISFMKSGAMGVNKDLTSLGPGPLREYLTRLADWSILAAPAAGTKTRWRLLDTSSVWVAVWNGLQAPSVRVVASGATALEFRSPVVGATCSLILELAFIHSRDR